jgi:ketosteroid isomerase-like protein
MKNCILHVTISIAILSFAFGQSSAQQNSENSKSEQEVRQIIEKFRSALVKGDVLTLQQIWANDYVFVNPSGEVLTKEQRLANIRSGATKLEAINQQEDTKIRVYQNSAVSTSRETVKGHYSGQPNSGQYRITSVWVKNSEGWQLVSTQMIPVAPSKPGAD